MTRSPTQDHPTIPTLDGRRQGGTMGGSRIPIVIRRQLGTVEVIVGGELDALGSELLTAAISDLVDGQGNLDVIVDLVGLAQIAPSTLEAIAAGAQASAERGGRLRLRVAAYDGVLTAVDPDGLLIAPHHPTAIHNCDHNQVPRRRHSRDATSQIPPLQDKYRDCRWHVP